MNKAFVILALGLSVSLAAQAETIYRTTDAQGNVVFTDNPERGGEKVDLKPLTVVPGRDETRAAGAPAVVDGGGSGSGGGTAAGPGQPFMPYDSFGILSPRQEETLPTGAAGNVQVTLGIQPDLREDHRVRLLVDGQVSQTAMHTDTFMLNNLNRGEHVLQAELLDASGAVRHRTSPVTLYVQRASVNLPQNPNNPANN
ncbi:DUF4124 domain-containing protein [Halomonas sp. CKK8]|jgi:hypothetical protein|uniref:DUF4124 domain-containing protein n=1 Tax=Halomonas sp. CKK8 TaxID=3036127 RepID=UPI00241508A3|nr:DUF4124 domain-containing protein [Halomonas sp. CKK8]WFM71109.1 DUF4124 domain-containing protein [Halomonas sp. CKK8]